MKLILLQLLIKDKASIIQTIKNSYIKLKLIDLYKVILHISSEFSHLYWSKMRNLCKVSGIPGHWQLELRFQGWIKAVIIIIIVMAWSFQMCIKIH